MNSTITNISFRNLTRQKKRSVLLGSAIAFGVMIVTVINGFAGAFSANVSENFANLMAGHVFISGSEKNGDDEVSVIRDDSALTAAVQAADGHVTYVTRRSSFSGTLIFEGTKLRTNVDGAELEKETFLRERLLLKEGSWDSMSQRDALILSEKIAAKLNATIGDRILVQMETVTGQNNVGEFSLAGISYDAGILGQMMSYANLSYVNELIGLGPDEYQTMGVMLDSLGRAEGAADEVYAALQGASVQLFERGAKDEDGAETPFQALMRKQSKEEWAGVKYRLFTINDMLSQIQQIVVALDTTAAVILVVLFVIIMVGITNTFSMVMFERIREIGTMRALGVQRGGVRSMFLLEAVFLALGGAVVGILAAMLVMGGLSLINFGMDSPAFIIMKNGHLSFYLPPLKAIGNVLIIAVLTLLAVARPAGKAARLLPAEALRTQK